MPDHNDENGRDALWRRHEGDPWAAFDSLPPAIRHRLMEHAYDPWPVNALHLWRHYKRVHGPGPRAERALLRYLDYCERLEQDAFVTCRAPLPHVAAKVSIQRYGEGPKL